jgi:hypothetical protein
MVFPKTSGFQMGEMSLPFVPTYGPANPSKNARLGG